MSTNPTPIAATISPTELEYTSTEWRDTITPLNAEHLNNIETGIVNSVKSIKWLHKNQLAYEDELILNCNNNWFVATSD